MSCPEISLVVVLYPSVSAPSCRPCIFLFRCTMGLSVNPWVSMPCYCLLSWYMVGDHLVVGSIDVLPHVIH